MKKLFNKLKPVIAIAIYMLVGAAIGFMAASTLFTATKGATTVTSLIIGGGALLAIYVVMYLQVILHEAGHLVCGLLTGYRYVSFRIASFMLVNEAGKIKLKRMSLAGTGGQCLMSPPDLVDGKIPYRLYNFGGAIFNILSAVLCFIAYIFCKDISYLATFLIIAGTTGVLFAFTNGIPLAIGGVNNDGKNALDVSKSKDAMRAFWIQMKIAEQTSKGVRIKDMPSEWFTLPAKSQMKNGIIATVSVFAENRLLDQHDFSEAQALLQTLSSEYNAIIGLHRNLLACDNIYCKLINKDKIDDLLTKKQKQFMKQMRKFPTVIRTEYAIALLSEQNEDKAYKALLLFEKCAKNYPYEKDIEGERELIDIAKNARTI